MFEQYFWQIGCILMFFILVFGCYGSYATTVVAWSRPPVPTKNGKGVKAAKLETKDLVLCYVPLAQVCMVKKAMYGSSTVENVLSIVSSAGIVLNLLNKFLLPINGLVMFICNIIMILCTAIALLLYGIVTARCTRAYGYGWMSTLIAFIIPCQSCMWLKSNIAYKMKQLHKEEAFTGNGSSTVIKSRTN